MDRPTLTELVDAVRTHLESNIVPAVKGEGRLYFQTLIAINVLKIVEREISLRPIHQRAEWARLNALIGQTDPMSSDPDDIEAGLEALGAQIRMQIEHGAYDHDAAKRRMLFDHLMATTHEALEIANPKLLQTMETETDGVE